jgi:hypothetical protein
MFITHSRGASCKTHRALENLSAGGAWNLSL